MEAKYRGFELAVRQPAQRARGCTHQHAIRILGRAWCGVIWRLWQDHDVYDPNRHRALQRVLAAQNRIASGTPLPDLTATQRPIGAAVTAGCPQGRARSA
jgi:hypothetical protein